MQVDETVIPKFTVKTLSDRAILVDLTSEVKSIAKVKEALSRKELVSVERQLLIANGRVLSDSDPAPTENTTIYLFPLEPTAMVVDSIETAADWDTKNRLRVFKGLYLFSCRKFDEAAPLLTDALTTFSETAFIPFKDLVKYATLAAMLVMDRPSIHSKLIKSPEVLEVIDNLPHLGQLINAFHNCRYSEFFQAIARIESDLKDDWLIRQHCQYIVKELRIRAYRQILQSYRSLSLVSLARSFGVSVDFIDRELSRFISGGRLDCIIDKVQGIVFTNPPDKRNGDYEALVKQSDALVARIQKLERIVSY